MNRKIIEICKYPQCNHVSFNECFRTRSKLLSNLIRHLVHARGPKSPDMGGPEGPGVAISSCYSYFFQRLVAEMQWLDDKNGH